MDRAVTVDSLGAPIKVVVTDDNRETNAMICQCINSAPGFEVVGTAFDGAEALELLKHISCDVLLLDIVMPRVDGFGFLRRQNTIPEANRPQILVLTSAKRDEFIERAFSYGAGYYMIKPFDPEELISCITDLANQPRNDNVIKQSTPIPWARPDISPDERVASLLLSVGIPAHIKGYQFLRESVRLVVNDRDIITRITKELYPTVARNFKTTDTKVERAIRHAIEVAWNRGRIDALNHSLGVEIFAPNDKPTNGEFIALVADRIKAECGSRQPPQAL